jgi:hypothetical protein
MLAALAACDVTSPGGPPAVESVAPAPLKPGVPLRIEGRGFGEAPGGRDGAALGGRPLFPLAWGPTRLAFEVPVDTPAGATWLVVRAGGQTLPPFPVEVGGRGRYPPNPSAPPGADRDADARDAGVGTTDGAPAFPDVRLPDATLTGAVATFTPDDVPATGTVLVEVEGPPGELTLEVRSSTGLWGQAFHLTYDPNLLQFVSATPPPSIDPPALHWSLVAPGRLAYGGLERSGQPALRVRFAVIGEGEGRVDVPARTASARADGNRPVSDWRFVGGSVRIQVRP